MAQGVLLAKEGGDPGHSHRRGGAPLQAHGAHGALRVRIGEGVEPGRAVALGDAGLGVPPAIARVRAPELHRGVHHQRPGGERLLPPRRPRSIDLEPPPHRLGVLRAVAVLNGVRGDLLPHPAQARRAPARPAGLRPHPPPPARRFLRAEPAEVQKDEVSRPAGALPGDTRLCHRPILRAQQHPAGCPRLAQLEWHPPEAPLAVGDGPQGIAEALTPSPGGDVATGVEALL